MMIIEAENVWTGERSKWVIPTISEAHRHNESTWASQYDHVERKQFTGGLPMVWKKVD